LVAKGLVLFNRHIAIQLKDTAKIKPVKDAAFDRKPLSNITCWQLWLRQRFRRNGDLRANHPTGD
jgi:hypothetical protein